MVKKSKPHGWVYKSKRWLSLRELQLIIEPLCRMCKEIGMTTEADTVDHIIPHRGNRELAFDPDNLQSLCEECHNRHAQMKDKGEPVAGCDQDGYPIDPLHKWHLTKRKR